MEDTRNVIRATLTRMSRGDPAAAGDLFPLVYEELRAVARRLLAGERKGHTLRPTELVHDVFLRLVESSGASFNDESHFRAVASLAMRRMLIDHARRKRRERDVEQSERPAEPDRLDLLALDEALEKLVRTNARAARIIEMRYFGGMTVEQAAAALDVSRRTVQLELEYAHAWLKREFAAGAAALEHI